VYVRGYRYRLPVWRPDPTGGVSWYQVVLHRTPYDRAVRLARLDDPAEIFELHWYRDERSYLEHVGVATAQVTGDVELDEPFPGVLVPPGTEIEELELEDARGFAAVHAYAAVRPPPRHRYDADRRLAHALVDRLAPKLPPGWLLAVSYGELLILHGVEVVDATDVRWSSDDDSLAATAWAVLDRVQDAIAEATAEPWPNERRRLPSSRAEIRDGALHLRYEDAEGVVLELEPIPLAEVTEDEPRGPGGARYE
jgi:hypothetical protein